ncbi:acetyl-CoA carboxylase biotin carboxylase subunit [Cyclobacterium sp.]|uniref:acetyl-CoA carboxylase biotin carboxylase subunit n=1 Tax=Cyclobacterium sp. TaxID=1966343 RepID=UPI0025C01B7A|nr:acetyl-CoA carboxylase biotin carboxylase subunit [Cyclobacterium sp.]
MKIKKLLVANRGEISLRIMRTAKEMGIKTLAVYSEADVFAPHVRFADQAVCIGPSPASQSYLNQDAILQAAKKFDVDAIHPGYGFLSENAAFAQRVIDAGLLFIGPTPQAIATMGDKLAAKKAVAAFDIPLVPGTTASVTDLVEADKAARNIGFPLMIKASAGGGGKGMRIVHDPVDLGEELSRAMGEAKSAFGDAAVFLEKFIQSPKHVEIQILADQQGHTIHLFDRECSVQRRHQKVIEEAPSPSISPATRKAMGDAAILVAKACNYTGAGTVEFILDRDQNFYFLEMNTRLQVEHPVTECITGIDLVKAQINIAEGKALPWSQNDLKIRGNAMEIRVYAEDPKNQFLPDTGSLQVFNKPEGPGIRVDIGYEEGMEIPIFYDPLIGKLIVYAEDRSSTIDKMKRAIGEFKIHGVKNTLGFCNWVMQQEAFVNGTFTTHFIDQYFKPDMLEDEPGMEEKEAVAFFVSDFLSIPPASGIKQMENGSPSKWKKRKIN